MEAEEEVLGGNQKQLSSDHRMIVQTICQWDCLLGLCNRILKFIMIKLIARLRSGPMRKAAIACTNYLSMYHNVLSFTVYFTDTTFMRDGWGFSQLTNFPPL